ncbi:MAG: CoA transferase [Sphingopyxis sp.]|nr:CoA transferase [Sphingopyxis sp.]
MPDDSRHRAGPLSGLRVVEMGAIGPAPMAAMMLSDLGATIVRIDRRVSADLGVPRPLKFDIMRRGRPSITLDLKDEPGRDCARDIINGSDVLIEGFRPGVMERLGLGPSEFEASNRGLVYARMTGWGQTGPLADAAGHDLNYIGLTGALHMIGRRGDLPAPPHALLGDLAGGGLYLVAGILSALWERSRSGEGQVIDAAIIDGVASMLTPLHGMIAGEIVKEERGSNALDSGAFFYDVYECSDGKLISFAPIEAKFLAIALDRLGIEQASLPAPHDAERWDEGKTRIAERFCTKTRDEWCAIFEGTDGCVAPVLTPTEAFADAHMRARKVFFEAGGINQGAPAPRFSRTPPAQPAPPLAPDSDVDGALAAFLSKARVAHHRETGALS